MIPNIEEKEEEIKKIYFEHRDDMRASKLYKDYLGDYFDVESWTINNKDWLYFLIWIREWKKIETRIKREQEAIERSKEITDEEVEEVQKKNRKKMIVMLSDLISNYEESTDPARKALDVAEVRRMYASIQALEEQIKRTEISKGKLKLEAVKTLLPYQRMSLSEIQELKEKLNDSFGRIIKLKSGEPVRESAPVNG